MTAPFPERIGRYDVLLPIASGGMGTVYLARMKSIGGFEREVALKVMHAHLKADPEFSADLVHEAKLTVRIRHPNVVSVLDVGDDPFGIYLVMDYVEGDTLAGLQKRASPLPLRIGVKLLLDALAGLHAAHELKDDAGRPSGLVHRDFSPQNILVGTDGVGRLTDFGVAKAASRASNTSSGIIKGKISYMSPEQARGERLDRRTDVWAAGVVAWQLAAGRKLHSDSGNEAATLLRVATQAPPRLRDVNPAVPAAVGAAIAQALEMDVDRRFATAQAFRQALAAACAGDVADVDEVSAYVARLCAPAIEEQRRRVIEISQLRQKVGALADGSASAPTISDVVDEATMMHTGATRSNVASDLVVSKRRWPLVSVAGASAVVAVVATLAISTWVHRTHAVPSESTSPATTARSLPLAQSASASPTAPVAIEQSAEPQVESVAAVAAPSVHGRYRPKHRESPAAATTNHSFLPTNPYVHDAGARHP